MSINTKLVLLLTLTVGAVMLVASFLSLRQREAALRAALSDELRAHAVTLQIALEEYYAGGRAGEAQRLIDRLRENSRVYGVLIYDERARLLTRPQSEMEEIFGNPPELAQVLGSGEAVEFVRDAGGRDFLCLLLPLDFGAGKRGALEIIKPLALIEDDIAASRLRWLVTTLLLLAVIFLVVYVVTERGVARPIRALLEGAEALGRGDLSHRVAVVPKPETGGELARLANEFNRMADSLEAQRSAVLLESENRLNLEKQLRHSERLAAVGRLAAGIAHELGAPLNVIDARAEQLLAQPDAAPAKRERNLQIIRRQSSRIAHVVRQLLNLARPYNLRFAPVEIGEVIRAALEALEKSSENKVIEIRFEAAAAAENLIVRGDRDFLAQVFTNIFRNAVQAMDGAAAGELKIECRRAAEDRFVAVEIADTGGGIAPDALDKIFDPFYTTKDIGQGTGLGLAVARRIVEEHDGRLEASNRTDGRRGAVFTVYLPLAVAAAE
jgi:two-component system, NtrC family, sensor kinase